MNSFNTPTPNFDNLLLQSLTGRLHPRPPPSTLLPPFLSDHSLEDLLLLNNLNLSDTESDIEDSSSYSPKTQLAKEESKLEKEIIRTILAGNSESLKPNSGQAANISDHHICVGFHEDKGSDYRVWEWHGHIMLFDEDDGYTAEYIYGNYMERVKSKEDVKKKEKVEKDVVVEDDDYENEEDEKEGNVSNLGLKDLIDSGEANGGRILHRIINALSPRF